MPSPSLQLAYSAATVDLTARFLKEGREPGDFVDAENRIWNYRVGDLEKSEARELVSRRLREERSLTEEAVVNQVARVELMGWDTKKEAAEAIAAYMKEAMEEMGPTFLEMSAATVRDGEGCKDKHEARMPVGEMLHPMKVDAQGVDLIACLSQMLSKRRTVRKQEMRGITT